MKRFPLILAAGLLVPQLGLPQGRNEKNERGTPLLERVQQATEKVQERARDAREKREERQEGDRPEPAPAPESPEQPEAVVEAETHRGKPDRGMTRRGPNTAEARSEKKANPVPTQHPGKAVRTQPLPETEAGTTDVPGSEVAETPVAVPKEQSDAAQDKPSEVAKPNPAENRPDMSERAEEARRQLAERKARMQPVETSAPEESEEETAPSDAKPESQDRPQSVEEARRQLAERKARMQPSDASAAPEEAKGEISPEASLPETETKARPQSVEEARQRMAERRRKAGDEPTEKPSETLADDTDTRRMARGSDDSQPARDTDPVATPAEQDPSDDAVAQTDEGRPKPTEAVSAETRQVLQDRGRRDQEADARRARDLESGDDAQELIQSILGGSAAGAIASRLTGDDRDQRNRDSERERGDRDRDRDFDRDHDRHDGRGDHDFDGRHGRLPASQVGRTDDERRETVDYLIRRLEGRASLDDAPIAFRRGPDFRDVRDQRDGDRYRRGDRDGRHDDRDRYDRDHRLGGRGDGDWDRHHHHPHYFDGNRRVVWYSSRNSIPAILLASSQLNHVSVNRVVDSPYRVRYLEENRPEYYEQIPATYQDDDAYAVSYQVDPNSAISQDDILFEQGSTALADAYSYDLVADMAEAMTAPELNEAQFVIEGHASAEGSYDNNLRLSQDRAERIARDLVEMGVDPDRLIPVGYGETEAEYPADAAESLRALDRRVMVFRRQ